MVQEAEESSSEELLSRHTKKKQKVHKQWEVIEDTAILSHKVTRFLSHLAAIMEFHKLQSLNSLLESFSSSSNISYTNNFEGVMLFNKCKAYEDSIICNGFLMMKTLVELAIWTAR